MTATSEAAAAETGAEHVPDSLEEAIAGALPLAQDAATLTPEPGPPDLAGTHASASLIIASGGQDVPPEEVIAWIAPLLRGLPEGSWFLFTLVLTPQGLARASCIGPDLQPAAEIVTRWPAGDHARFSTMVPGGAPLIIVLLEDGHSQLFALLDVISDWLCRFEPGHCAVQSLFRLIGAFEVLTGR